MGKQSAILFENKIDLVILKKTEDDNKSSNALTFFLPTSENARNLAMYLKRCLEEKEFTVDLLYSSPDGYKSLYWDGPAHIKYTDEKFTGLHNVREERGYCKNNAQGLQGPAVWWRYDTGLLFLLYK